MQDEPTAVGRLAQILEVQARDKISASVFLVVQKYNIGALHGRLCMPTIHASSEETLILARIPVGLNSIK